MKAHGLDGATFESHRLALGLSREALGAEAGGISSSTIRRIERGTVSPHRSTVAALARALGFPRDTVPALNDERPQEDTRAAVTNSARHGRNEHSTA